MAVCLAARSFCRPLMAVAALWKTPKALSPIGLAQATSEPRRSSVHIASKGHGLPPASSPPETPAISGAMPAVIMRAVKWSFWAAPAFSASKVQGGGLPWGLGLVSRGSHSSSSKHFKVIHWQSTSWKMWPNPSWAPMRVCSRAADGVAESLWSRSTRKTASISAPSSMALAIFTGFSS